MDFHILSPSWPFSISWYRGKIYLEEAGSNVALRHNRTLTEGPLTEDLRALPTHLAFGLPDYLKMRDDRFLSAPHTARGHLRADPCPMPNHPRSGTPDSHESYALIDRNAAYRSSRDTPCRSSRVGLPMEVLRASATSSAMLSPVRLLRKATSASISSAARPSG